MPQVPTSQPRHSSFWLNGVMVSSPLPPMSGLVLPQIQHRSSLKGWEGGM